MAMFTAYFDASGSAAGQPYVIVAGYVASFFQWQRFEDEWSKAHLAFNVELPFHSTEFRSACVSDTYKHQSNARADYVEIAKNQVQAQAFLEVLGKIQTSFIHCGISCIIPMDVYEGVSSLLPLQEVLPPYALGARMCIEKLHQWEKKFLINPPAEYIFESGDLGQGKFTDLMVDEGEAVPIYKNKADFAGLQAADYYAWEQFYILKNLKRGMERETRKTLYFLLEAIPKLHTSPTQEWLIRLCERKGIDPRTGVKK